MNVTADQVAALAPDAAVLADGRKLAASASWRNTGRSDRAAWGECQGSAVYQVRADLADLATKCSCPSRKFPCKHGVALLLIVAQRPMADEVAPAWVSEWLAKRAEAHVKREEKKDKPQAAPADPEAQAKRAAKRHERVLEGLDALDLWMEDLVRGGFASMPRQRPSVFEAQAARLVDAQAPGLAGRLRRLDVGAPADDANAAIVLAGLGRLALLSRAYRRVDSIGAALAADVRHAVGWTVELDEVASQGERVSDDWVVLGSCADEEDRVRVQRSWLRGARTGREALVLQFAAGAAPFAETYATASTLSAELAYWPSAWPQRAIVRERRGAPGWFDGRLPGHPTFAAFLDSFAVALAKQPWLERVPCVLHDVTIGCPPTTLADRDGRRIDIAGSAKWQILARSGGAEMDVAGEWDGERLRPLLWRIGGRFVLGDVSR